MTELDSLHPIFRERLERLLQATGCGVRSGWRSSEEQAYLYNCYLTGACNNGNPANAPGSSNHEAEPYGEPAGLAVDLEGDLAAAHARAAEFGIHFPIVNVEPWHAQPTEVPYAYFTGLPEGWSLGGGSRFTLKRGARGQVVVELQQRLNVHGVAVDVDGDFGPATEAAVLRFQEKAGLGPDGVAGPATWGALDVDPAQPQPAPAPLPGAGRRSPDGLQLSSQGAALIAEFEGVVLGLYNDPAGHCTVGIGHLVHEGPICGCTDEAPYCGELTTEFVYRLFTEQDAPRYAQGVRDRVRVPLYQSEFDALVSFVYNLGPGALDESESTLARLLNQGDYAGAADQFGRWVKAGEQTLEGLVRRRAAEAALFRSEWASTPPPPPPTPVTGFPAFPGRMMREGDSGEDVRAFQAQLAHRGWTSVVPDGIFGPATADVVRRFQSQKGLEADGIVGPTTWDSLWRSSIT